MSGMDIRNEARGYIRDRLVDMVIDYNVIKYRQDILKDFMKCPDIEERFDTTMLPAITNLRKMEKANLSHDDNLRQIALEGQRKQNFKLESKCSNHGLMQLSNCVTSDSQFYHL